RVNAYRDGLELLGGRAAFKRTQKIPPCQQGVALPSLILRRVPAPRLRGVVGIRGTVAIDEGDKPGGTSPLGVGLSLCHWLPRRSRMGEQLTHPVGCQTPTAPLPSNGRLS